jgi:hypothetical protein
VPLHIDRLASLTTHPLPRVLAGTAAAGALVAALSTTAATQATPPSPRSFTFLAPGYTQELFATVDVGTYPPPNQAIAKVLGGVAFTPDGDVWSADCVFQGTTLHRFDLTTYAPGVYATTSRRAEILSVATADGQGQGPGCGLANHPDGAMYSNSIQGIYKLDVETGATLAGPLGQPGNALGLAVDPVSSHLVYAGADCHGTLIPGAPACTLWDLDPATGLTTPFAMFPHIDVPFVDGIYFSPGGDHLFVTNRINREVETSDGSVAINQLTVVSRPVGPVTLPSTTQIVRHLPMAAEPDGIAFHSAQHFVVTNDEASGTMTRFDFPGGDYSQPPTTFSEIQPVDGAGDPVGDPIRIYGSPFAGGGHRGDLTQVGADGCIYATQGRNFFANGHGTRYDDGTQTGEDSIVRICSEDGSGFEPPPGVKTEGPRGSVVGSIFLDTNGNHAIDATDTFLSGVTVTLGGSSAAPVASTGGPTPAYAFTSLSAGAYAVNVPATHAGYVLSASTPSGTAATITVAGEDIADIDFLYEAGQLTGSVYLDVNDSGTIDGGDTFLQNVPVDLAGEVVAVTLSLGGPAPSYSFPGLPGGDYRVSVPPAFGGYKLHSTSPAPRTLMAGATVSNVDFLYVRASLSGFAYVDMNNDGVRNAGDLPLPSVMITGPGGATRTTAADGSYAYSGLAADVYAVGASTPAGGYALSTASPLSVTVPAGGSAENVNFGYRPGGLSGFAYIDANLNGVKDPGENGLGNVGIVLSTGGSASTQANGSYAFGDLRGGSYTLGAPSTAFGYLLVTAPTLTITLPAGQSLANLNFGYAAPPPAAFVTYTQGGWGAPPNGNNPGMLLQTNFNAVYSTCPSKTSSPTTTANTCVTIGIPGETGRFFLRFTSSTAVMNFLPAGGAPKALKASANNPTSSAAGVFAGQVLAAQLAVNFSNAGVITPGLASLKVASGHPLAGQTVSQVLAIANRVLGGDLAALPPGMSISALNNVMTRINENFDNGTTNNGFLVP